MAEHVDIEHTSLEDFKIGGCRSWIHFLSRLEIRSLLEKYLPNDLRVTLTYGDLLPVCKAPLPCRLVTEPGWVSRRLRILEARMESWTRKPMSSKRYPPELRERAARTVGDLRQVDPGDQGVLSRVARQLGIGKETFRAWAKEAEIDASAEVR